MQIPLSLRKIILKHLGSFRTHLLTSGDYLPIFAPQKSSLDLTCNTTPGTGLGDNQPRLLRCPPGLPSSYVGFVVFQKLVIERCNSDFKPGTLQTGGVL